MNTNDLENEQPEYDTTLGDGRIFGEVLQSLAEKYFPELSQNCESDLSSISEPTVPTENDFIRAIADVCKTGNPSTGATQLAVNRESEILFSHLYCPAVVPACAFDIDRIRGDFPILSEKVDGKDLVWLDNAATTQKPSCVIKRLKYFYEHENSNVHRGAHTLAARTTDAFEDARTKIAEFIHASSAEEIVFVRGATEAINLVAWSYARQILAADDEIVVSELEHHANIVPWQMVCAETGAKLRVIPVDENGQIILAEYEKLLGPKTKIVAFTHVSNVTGTVTPAAEMTHMAHRYGAKVLIDGAQGIAHLGVDVGTLDCDFYAFSGHKLYGPTGIGVLYGKAGLLESMRPYQGGGNMISDVTFEKTTYQSPPHRFEAGTANIAGAIGLGAAIGYITSIGMEPICQYERQLWEYAADRLQSVPGLTLVAAPKEKASVLSFTLQDKQVEDVGQFLNSQGIAVRAGHHCAQPILRRFGLESSVRVSLAFYNTFQEIDFLTSVLRGLAKKTHIF